jgi:hypothetical protein
MGNGRPHLPALDETRLVALKVGDGWRCTVTDRAVTTSYGYVVGTTPLKAVQKATEVLTGRLSPRTLRPAAASPELSSPAAYEVEHRIDGQVHRMGWNTALHDADEALDDAASRLAPDRRRGTLAVVDADRTVVTERDLD